MSFNSYLLGTNVISEAWKSPPNKGVTQFLSKTPASQTYLSLFTVTELRFGVNLLPAGKRRTKLEQFYQTVLAAYRPRIISPDLAVAEVYAHLAARERRSGTTKPIFDLWLAATAKANDLTLVTRNLADFDGLDIQLENPFESF